MVNEDGLYTGKIVIKSKNSQFKVTIPYRAHVLSGHLFVNESITHFHLKDRWGYEEDSQQESSSTDKTDTKDNKEGDIVHNPIGEYTLKIVKFQHKYFYLIIKNPLFMLYTHIK